jgi:DNA-binding transcriptional MocR family regulator
MVGRDRCTRLSAALREAIRDGRLPAGSALPPSRALAESLGCSRWVVTEAYAQLAAEGYLEARVGSGIRVRPLGPCGCGHALSFVAHPPGWPTSVSLALRPPGPPEYIAATLAIVGLLHPTGSGTSWVQPGGG